MAETMTITIHRAELPPTIHGAVTTENGSRYTIILNAGDEPARQLAAFLHEMTHIYNGDLITAGGNAGEIEARTHRQILQALELLTQEKQEEQQAQEIQQKSQKRPKKDPNPGAIRDKIHYFDIKKDTLEAGQVYTAPAGYYRIKENAGDRIRFEVLDSHGISAGGTFGMDTEKFINLIGGKQ